MRHMSYIAKAALLVTFCITPAMAQREESVTLRTSELKVDPANPVIDLTISSSVQSAPDIASFSTGVETLSLKAKDALTKNSTKMSAVVAQLKAAGIEAKDIKTSAISMARDYDYLPTGKQRFKGYRVSNTVTARLRDMAKLGDILDALVANGATEFNGPKFALDDKSAAEAQARDKAWESALTKARYHAKKAGFSDVRVVHVAESVRQSEQIERNYTMIPARYVGPPQDAAAPLEGGEIETKVTLSISFLMIR